VEHQRELPKRRPNLSGLLAWDRDAAAVTAAEAQAER
jgi:hypothetical protein